MVSEIICEQLAHQAGFIVSVGNWISPDGSLITGRNYESHHWETLIEHLGQKPETDNHLVFMNNKVNEGYIRLVFRTDVLFQVGANKKEELWGDAPYFQTMRDILKKIGDTEVHIFSKKFYVIGMANNILNQKMELLQIKEMP